MMPPGSGRFLDREGAVVPELIPRSAWTSVPRPTGSLTRMVAEDVRGVAVHWPGSPGSWGAFPSQATSARRLEAERVQHTSPSTSDPSKPWADIAYSLACDLAGRVFDCRGVDYRPAANGDRVVNGRYVAVTVLMGVDDDVTTAAVEGVRFARRLVLARFPHAVEVVGHRDVHQTECPGPRLYDLVRSGAFTEPTTVEDQMTPAEMTHLIELMAANERLLDAVGRRVWSWEFPAPTSQEPGRTETSGERLVWASRGSALAPTLDTVLGAVRALADVDGFAAAIAARLPAGGVDATAVASAVRAELGRALTD